VANTVSITVDADTTKAENNVKGMGGKMKTAMKGVAMASGAITLAAAAAVTLGQEYQEATNTIAAGTGATGEQLEGLTDSFKNVWTDVPQDAAAVSSALADVNTELGFEGEKLEEVTKAFLDAGRVMGEDTAPLIKAVTDSLIAFGEDADGAEISLDRLMVASQAVGVPMTQLAQTVVDFGPQLATMGLNVDEATALVANMEAAGLSASKMMPGLNTAVKKLTSEGITDISAGLKDMIDRIKNAETESEGLALATDLFGAGAGVRFKDAIDKGVFSLSDMISAMEAGDGKVKEMAASTLTTSDKFDILKNRVKASLTPIGNFANSIGPMVIMIPALATGISAMAASQTIATAATWLQTAAMTALNVAMGPIGLVILGIALAIGGIILAFKNWDKIMGVIKTAIDTLKTTWDTVFGAIKRSFDTIVGAMETAYSSKLGWLLPGGSLIKALEFLKENWDTIWTGISTTVTTVVDGLKSPVNLIIGLINAVIGGLNKIAFDIPNIPGIPGRGTRFGINIPLIPSLAQGGIVNRPTLAMIGEKGPEAVVPLGKAGGVGGGITINILGPTYGFDDFSAKVSQAVRDGVRRGGYQGVIGAA
jgi:phage-related minor tail protein